MCLLNKKILLVSPALDKRMLKLIKTDRHKYDGLEDNSTPGNRRGEGYVENLNNLMICNSLIFHLKLGNKKMLTEFLSSNGPFGILAEN